MNSDENKELYIEYMYIKNFKWKTKGKLIKECELNNYQCDDKYRILSVINSEEYYSIMERGCK